MKIVGFGASACGKIREYLDSYISSELLVETNHEVLRHLATCPSCAEELERRIRIRVQLKDAVERQAVPPELAAKVRARIRKDRAEPAFRTGWWRWAAVAAALLVTFGITWTVRPHASTPYLADRHAQDSFIQNVSETVSSMLRPGLRDHLHCAVFRKYPKDPPTLDQMAEKIGPAYKGLLPLVRSGVPEEYRVVLAHQCGYGGRRFVHLTLQKGSSLISVVITRKQEGETLATLPATSRPGGIPVYQSTAAHFAVAGFETGQYLAFVVSDLSSTKNLQMADRLAPGVHEFLSKAQG